jgi:hypothetical protein
MQKWVNYGQNFLHFPDVLYKQKLWRNYTIYEAIEGCLSVGPGTFFLETGMTK